MVKSLFSVYLFGMLAGLGAVRLALPSFIGYLILHKVKRGNWRSPFNWLDLITFLALGYALMITWELFPDEHRAKNMVNLLNELMTLGTSFSILLCARLPFVWKHPEWRLRFSILTAVVMMVASALIGSLVPPAGRC